MIRVEDLIKRLEISSIKEPKTKRVKDKSQESKCISGMKNVIKNVLESKAVPAAQQGIYYIFAYALCKKLTSYKRRKKNNVNITEVQKIVDDLQQKFVKNGTKPEILSILAELLLTRLGL